jgi:hypothetical protein
MGKGALDSVAFWIWLGRERMGCREEKRFVYKMET